MGKRTKQCLQQRIDLKQQNPRDITSLKSTVWAKLLSSLFQGFFGSVKMKSVIGFKQVVELLHQHGAPEEVWDW